MFGLNRLSSQVLGGMVAAPQPMPRQSVSSVPSEEPARYMSGLVQGRTVEEANAYAWRAAQARRDARLYGCVGGGVLVLGLAVWSLARKK